MTEERKLSVIIVDDHPIVREGLRSMLASTEDIAVAALLASGDELVDFCRRNGLPDLILMDIRMPGMGGFETFDRLKRFFPKARVLFVAGMPIPDEERKARAAGAAGYVSKSAPRGQLVTFMRYAAEKPGEFVSDEFVAAKSPLTPKEIEILQSLAEGDMQEEIAQRLGISQETVKSHVKTMRQKLEARNTVALVAKGYQLGILRK